MIMTVTRLVYVMPILPLIYVGFLIILRGFFLKNSASNLSFVGCVG